MQQVKLNQLEDYILKEYENGNRNDQDFQMQAIVNMPGVAKQLRKCINALLVIVNDEKTATFLQENDPKAYEQAVDAINNLGTQSNR